MANSYLISVSYAVGCYRHIQISGSDTLYRLHMAIQDAFCFDNDHPHGFFMDNRLWSNTKSYFGESLAEKECQTSRHALNKLRLKAGDQFKYLFGFGREWVFQCKVLRELTEVTLHPMVVRSVGQVPEQYPDDWLEDEDELEPGFPEIYDDARLKQLYQALPLPEETVKTLHAYFDAAANLYGIMPLGKLLEIYNQQNPPISQEAFLETAEVIRHEHNHYAILGQECFYSDTDESAPIDRQIVGDWLYCIDLEEYYTFEKAQAGKPFAIVSKEEFLRYTDQFYYPTTPESQAMTAFLKKELAGSEQNVQDAADEMMLHAFSDGDLESALDLLARFGFRFKSKAQLDEFLPLYSALNNRRRKQVNRGYSPEVLFHIMGAEPTLSGFMSASDIHIPIEEPKPIPTTLSGTPARSAPCPCGSGRKYIKTAAGKRNNVEGSANASVTNC